MACRKNMPGSPCCGECDMLLSELPTVNITGMSILYDWHWISHCCAEIDFTFDTPPANIVLDGGDVMTYDKTEVCKTENYTYDKKCGTVSQAFWTDAVPGSDRGYISEDYTTEPAYDCCNPLTLTQIHTLTKTVRSRGGQRFIVTLQATGISVVIKKVTDYVCDPAAAVTRYVMRSTYHYSGYYEYRNHGQVTATYTTTADATCWDKPANTSVGYYPFNIADPYTLGPTVGISALFCREKVLTTIPAHQTSYTFAVGDVPNAGCVFTQCIDCPPDTEICFLSGATGDGEPSLGFCEATIVTTETDSSYSLQLCLPHLYYWWSEAGCARIFENMFGAMPSFLQDAIVCCSNYSNSGTYTPAYFAAVCTIPSYNYASWSTLTAGGPASGLLVSCEYPSLHAGKTFAECWPTQSCAACPTGSQAGDSVANQVIAASTQTISKASGSRIVEITRSVTCSGYTQKSVCQPFIGWTIILQLGL